MAEQQQKSRLASRFGGQLAQLNDQYKDKPVEISGQKLPTGIKNGLAKLAKMELEETTEEKDRIPKGTLQLRATAVAMSPESHDGRKVAGLQMYKTISLCEQPAKGEIRTTTFEENYAKFQNLFKQFGISSPTGPQYAVNQNMAAEQLAAIEDRIIEYYRTAGKALTNPQKPVYFNFKTRGWTPPKTIEKPKPDEILFEDWLEMVDPSANPNGKHDPLKAVTVGAPAPSMPPSPPSAQPFDEFAPSPAPSAPAVTHQRSHTDIVAALVEAAMNDQDGATEEGMDAIAQLQEMAWGRGWTKEQTNEADDWRAVGEMCLRSPDRVVGAVSSTASASPENPTVGSAWKFAKRTKDGARMKNSKGEDFPPAEVKVVAVDAASQTCTLVYVKDGKPVVDIRSKEPIAARFDWLEPV